MTAIAKSDPWQVPPSSVDDETRIDEALLESFPASDPPSWTLGVNKPARADVIDVSRPSSRKPLWKALEEWLEVSILVPLVVFACMALAIPVVLVVMSVIDVASWVVSRTW